MPQLKPLRIVFFGSTKFAAQHLYTLIHSYIYQITAIFTHLAKNTFHNKLSTFSIENIAKRYNIPLFQYSSHPNFINIIHIIKTLNTDLIIVVSCGLILPKKIINIPKLGCINVHGSLLPRWRGPAPIQRALEYGDTTTGISIIKIDTGIDTGQILKTAICKISPQDTTNTLSKKLSYIGATTLLHVLKEIISNTCKATPQDSSTATYAPKLTKKEARINWNTPAIQLEKRIRAFNPWPICYFSTKKNIHIKIWNAKIDNDNLHIKNYIRNKRPKPGTILTANANGIHVITSCGILILTVLQIPGKKITSVKDILNSKKEWFTPYSLLK